MLTPGSSFRFKRATQPSFLGMETVGRWEQILPIGIYVVRQVSVVYKTKSFEFWKSTGRKVRQGELGRKYLPTRYVLVEVKPPQGWVATVLHSIAPGTRWQKARTGMIQACNDLEKGGKLEEVLRYL